ncbi:MAG TPA: serine hydrolase [Thermoleophilia bacterium]|nr:serine hydrolase [Thermoleophilia bacterium]
MADRSECVLVIERLETELRGRVGVAARALQSGAEILYRADEPFPLASVFKVPLMVALLRAVDTGDVTLDERIELTERVKSPGSTLIHCDPGLRPTVRDLLYLTITLSDNTATDMLWRRLGPRAINEAMRGLGLERIDCSMPNREYFLLEAVRNGEWEGMSADDVVARWRSLDGEERRAVLQRIEELNAGLTGADFLHRWVDRYGWGDESDYDDAFAFDQALDNRGTPRDLAELLAMIAKGRCASRRSCELMVEVLSRQEWRARIPAGLPPGLRVANKTGSVAGTVNDAAIVYPGEGPPIVLVVFCGGLGYAAQQEAEATIARIASAVYASFSALEGRTDA